MVLGRTQPRRWGGAALSVPALQAQELQHTIVFLLGSVSTQWPGL